MSNYNQELIIEQANQIAKLEAQVALLEVTNKLYEEALDKIIKGLTQNPQFDADFVAGILYGTLSVPGMMARKD